MKRLLLTCAMLLTICVAEADNSVKSIRMLNNTTVEVLNNDGQLTTLDFYAPNIFRLFRDNNGGILRKPEATPPADILVAKPRKPVGQLLIEEGKASVVSVVTTAMRIDIDKQTVHFNVVNTHQSEEIKNCPLSIVNYEFKNGGYNLQLSMQPDEYFYGGGVQNGRFSHRGKRIDIVNTNSWTDGGVCSPTPFYWSTAGYGVLCHTFCPGYYDFTGDKVLIHHDADYLDVFFFLGETPVDLLNGYYQLTGNPVLLPKFAFYEGHLNAYNRDYWKETDDPQRGVPFEDGKRYTESQTDNGGVHESLNGDVGDYQFSARAVVDRYFRNDMPLGWVLPNDGYGAGYGQTETLDGNIANLKSFGEYARSKGVEIGLWTQSNLHPIDSIPALLQRDIVKEVRDAGVRVLKTDVAWVGAGYSFGLNGIADVADIMPYYGAQARPFIISLDGWAGTQRYAGIWTGDQTGGEWEYIRFHIPTFIGSGLAGQPNITNDMDGIFGGRNMAVNVRDFQWKTFTPMELNMDGWGANEKYPQALGEPATSINRSYLKWKSMLLPYTYTFAHEAIDGKPLIRAMFLDEEAGTKNAALRRFLLGTRTQYQFLYGPNILVAPIYQETKADKEGNDIRHDIYLPEGTWYDYFTGRAYAGGCILNSFDCPLWKLPVFVRKGAIIAMNNPNNNPSQIDTSLRILEVYPSEQRTCISVYDDDGTTDAYLAGENITYQVEQQLSKGQAVITIHPAEGNGYDGMSTEKSTRLMVNMTTQPKSVAVKVNGKTVKANWNYGVEPVMQKIGIRRPQQLTIEIPKTNIYNKVEVVVKGVAIEEASAPNLPVILSCPTVADGTENTAYTITPKWNSVEGANYYELMFEGMRYTNICDTRFTIDQLQPETNYQLQLRAVGESGVSEWTDFTMPTGANPLEFAMKGITATCTAAEQPGSGLEHLFDFDDHGDIWHTAWGNSNAVPFTIEADLHATTDLSHITYIPRDNAGNGNITAGTLQTSADGKTWSEPQPFRWRRDNTSKTFDLDAQGKGVRYVRLNVTEAVGGFGSGTELFIFRKPEAKVLIPGDINQDGRIDDNDFTSYLNYTGLRSGDSDFDGYVSVGDVNHNGLIDAQDISNIATQLANGAGKASAPLTGNVILKTDRQQYNAGDEIIITVSGHDLQAVNALSLVLPYNQQQMQFIDVQPVAVASMQNMTRDRLHTNGDRVLYPTFVNIGKQAEINGDVTLFHIRMKALQRMTMKNVPCNGMLVDRQLNAIAF